ncbi:MAG: ribosome biogenesis GTP-binding protein YihA/YsxC [Christensenella sp.]|uniref:ribosome biogenesis GTP-binding protein YihA/YsxC n=1 Tax=Christensenella sp. TaxID=1935934 RepID=UPI002B21DA02|nr:ribosome biogenesis GTP-binding protein YihA/YsxC [Christensenella sp.]MEA5002075.1 ribosome biogenesis GTP-binding protein YihA/YsxC [Christensenella sp.]
MEIKKAAFYKSMKKSVDYPGGDLPEIAFAGKSNVGKSSLINYLANNSKLAYVSKQPGKTRLINYFLINGSFYLVDLPGYGFARVSKTERKSWAEMMRDYFKVAQKLKALVILIDIRHNPTNDDMQMIEWAAHFGVPFMIAATKADKIAKSKRFHYVVQMAKYIGGMLDMDLDIDIVPVSSTDKKGKEDIIAYMEKMIAEDVPE